MIERGKLIAALQDMDTPDLLQLLQKADVPLEKYGLEDIIEQAKPKSSKEEEKLPSWNELKVKLGKGKDNRPQDLIARHPEPIHHEPAGVRRALPAYLEPDDQMTSLSEGDGEG